MKKQNDEKDKLKKITEEQNIQYIIDNFAKKYKNKKIIIYGAGLLSDIIFDNYDFTKLDVIAVADKKINDSSTFKSYKAIPPYLIPALKPDAIITALYDDTEAKIFITDKIFALMDEIPIESILKQNKIEKNDDTQMYFPPGHFYSPIPSSLDIKNGLKDFANRPKQMKGINIDDSRMLNLVKDDLSKFYNEIDFKPQVHGKNRYCDENDCFQQYDALNLHSMIRYAKPKRLIECGSGHSSAVILDTNEDFFNNSIKCTFIEPYPQRLKSILKESDKIEIFEEKVQNMPLELFKELQANDIFFVDTTHVIKFQNDVHYLFFEILPSLNKGTIIHFHDIFRGFDYPISWISQNWAWNEAYLMRAFLMYNDAFEVILWNDYLANFYKGELNKILPREIHSYGGSIWLRKVK